MSLFLPLSLFAADNPAQTPKTVASINLCADQLLLLLADRDNILSLGELAADPQYSYMASEAKGIPLNNGQAEQLIALAPDIVLAGEYNDKAALKQLDNFGVDTLILPLSSGLGSITTQVQRVADAIGEHARGEALVKELDNRLQQALANVPGGEKPVAVVYAPNGFTHGKHTLYDEILTRAGMINGASEAGLVGHGYMSLEEVLVLQPDYLIIEDSANNKNSMAQRMLSHPALVRGLPDARFLKIPANLWTCPGPSSILALELLIEQRNE